jgi:hypothetical protein
MSATATSRSTAKNAGVLIVKNKGRKSRVYFIRETDLAKYELTNTRDTNLSEAMKILKQASPGDSNVFSACGDFLMMRPPCCWLKIEKLKDLLGCDPIEK